jgi:hypothetical protein
MCGSSSAAAEQGEHAKAAEQRGTGLGDDIRSDGHVVDIAVLGATTSRVPAFESEFVVRPRGMNSN